MDNNTPDKPHWRFDPQTGQPVGDNPPPAQPPAQQPEQAAQPSYPYAPPPSQAPQDSFRVNPPAPPTQPQAYPPEQPQPQPQYTQPTQPYGYQQPPPQQPTQPNPPQPQYYGQQAPAPTPSAQYPTPTAKKGSKAPLIGIIALVLLLAIAGGGYFLYQKVFNPPGVTVERLLPANTLGYFSFNPSLTGSQKAAMDNIRQAFEAQPGFKEAWAKITSQAASLAGSGSSSGSTSPDQNLDVLSSYLGNSITVAILSPSAADIAQLKAATQSGDTGSVVSDVLGRNVVGIVDLNFDPLNKKGPISDLKQQATNAGKAELVEKYKDIEIRKLVTNTQQIYFTLLNGTSTAVVGAKVEPLRLVIDQFKDNTGLKDDAIFKTLSGQVPQERIASLYLNLSEIYKQAKDVAPESLQSSNIQNANGSILTTLSAANDGLQLDIASQANLSAMGTGLTANPNARPDSATLNDIPSNAIGFFAGTDLKTQLMASLAALRKDKNLGDNINQQIQDFEQKTGLSVDNDILPLLGGDYVISFSIDNNGSTSPSVVFQMKLADVTTAQRVLDRLATSLGGSSMEQVDVAGGKFYQSSGTPAIVGVTQNRLWLVSGSSQDDAKARTEAIVGNLGKGLGTSSDWNARKVHLPRDSNVIGYVDTDRVRQLVENTMSDSSDSKQSYETNVAPFVRPLKYLILGSASQATKDSGVTLGHMILFLGISK